VKVLIFTPTCRVGGLDISFNALCSQKLDYGKYDVTWLIVDDLYDQRKDDVSLLSSKFEFSRKYGERYYFFFRDGIDAKFNIVHMPSPKKEAGVHKNLASCYNVGLNYARENNFSVFISLQDYIGMKDGTINRLIDSTLTSKSLVTGICDHSKVMHKSRVCFKDYSNFSIFRYPSLDSKLSGVSWSDVRRRDRTQIDFVDPMEWEINLASIPEAIINDSKVNFDSYYDGGFAYENQDYAMQAQAQGYDICIDESVLALSAPHRSYFSKEAEFEKQLTIENMQKHKEKWGV